MDWKIVRLFLSIISILGSLTSSFPVHAQINRPKQSLFDQAAVRAENDLSQENTRVAHGSIAKWMENQWQVALVIKKYSKNTLSQFCGGTIISSNWIVTAAHCIDTGKKAEEYQILAGTSSLVSGGKRYDVVGYYVHPNYKDSFPDGSPSYDSDLALLKLKGNGVQSGYSVKILSEIEKLDLPFTIWSTGWGVTERKYQGTENLLGVTLPIVKKENCSDIISYEKKLTDNMFCAGYDNGQGDTCKGDSGGPAILSVDGKKLLAGVVSWGEGCGEPNRYGVYTSLPKFYKWISKTIAEH